MTTSADGSEEAPITRNAKPAPANTPSPAIFLGLVVGAIIGLGGFALYRRTFHRLEQLDAALLASAQQRWEEAGMDSYTIRVETDGRQAAVYEVTVDKGEVVRATRDGTPMTDPRTRGTWTVAGIFATLQSDVAAASRDPVPGSRPVSVRVRLDPLYGVPLQYIRVERAQQGANPEISWRVTQLAPTP